MTADVPRPEADARRAVFEAARLALARTPVAGVDSLRGVLRRVAEVSARAIQVERVGVWTLSEDRSVLRCCELYELSKNRHSAGTVLHARDFPAYMRALEERRDVPADDAPVHPLTHELRDAYLVPLGIGAMLDAPIFRDGHVIGVVCHEHVGKSRIWRPDERDFAGSVADMVALKLEAKARHEAEALLRASEAQLVEAQKMEAVGRLAAGIAHDFNNLLTVVISNAHHISRNREASPQVTELARQILEAGNRSVELTRELLQLAKRSPRAPGVFDLVGGVEAILGILRTVAGNQHQVELLGGVAAGSVFMDRSQLERMLVNLVVNARDAMPDGGAITLRVSEASPSGELGASRDHLLLEVIDTGVGMDAATRARIFEPFFTTKVRGSGTGLGLSIVYQIVSDCGGAIEVDSELGKGTTFRIHLPRVAAPA
ncbi:MAG TPA: ATP-binding protein [Myxococcota bacterium]|nr:ATP-binding protein [Myxococcota bacterium]